MSYTKQGVNYGIGQQSTAQIEQDLTYLRQQFDYIRISYPDFDYTPMSYWQDVCVRAKAHGLYVMWGISCPNTKTAQFSQFTQEFINLAPWAAANGIVLGVNEEMFHLDTTVMTKQAALAALQQMATTAKQQNSGLVTAISLAGDGELAFFVSQSPNNKAPFDFVCVNQYDTTTNAQANINLLTSNYGTTTSVTEFSTGRGFDPQYGTEDSWTADIKTRADYMENSPVAAFYIYTYYHNPQLTPSGFNQWNFRTNANNTQPATHHKAFSLFQKVV